jgi:hypothetical protein
MTVPESITFWMKPAFARRMSATARNFSRTHAKSRSSKLGSFLALHSIPDEMNFPEIQGKGEQYDKEVVYTSFLQGGTLTLRRKRG